MGKLLCLIGLHKWIAAPSEACYCNVDTCKRCGKRTIVTYNW